MSGRVVAKMITSLKNSVKSCLTDLEWINAFISLSIIIYSYILTSTVITFIKVN